MIPWLQGLILRRWGRMLGASLGIALAVGLLASLGSFLATSQATMTQRAARDVAVDWQVQTSPGTDVSTVTGLAARAPGTVAALPVTFAHVPRFTATTAQTTQTTGSGIVVGLPARYQRTFPGQLRLLTGSLDGVLVAQQTAANLHVGVGSRFSIGLTAASVTTVVVAGIVDLPAADSLFQRVGAPSQSQPIAPPDNVVLMPQTQLDTALAPLIKSRPDLITRQVHVSRSHQLPASPVTAYTQETGQARHLEVALAGAGLVGDNLGATLDAARKDASYACFWGHLAQPWRDSSPPRSPPPAPPAAARNRPCSVPEVRARGSLSGWPCSKHSSSPPSAASLGWLPQPSRLALCCTSRPPS